MKPTIGDIVLFKIDPTDFGIWRPLLVTTVSDDGSVGGELFLNWHADQTREWPTRHMFFKLTNANRTIEIVSAKLGDQVGEYKLREPGLLERLQAIEARIQGMGKLVPISQSLGKGKK